MPYVYLVSHVAIAASANAAFNCANSRTLADRLLPCATATRRRWAAGDTIALKLDLRGRLAFDPAGGGRHVAITRGPIVLALDNRLCPADAASALELEYGADGVVALTPNLAAAEQHGLRLAFDAPFVDRNGNRRKLALGDFASAGNRWSEQSLYRVWLPQPLDLAYVWQAGSPRWWQKFRQTRPEMPAAPAR